MKKLFKKSSIATKVKEAFSDISVDIFGYEKMITKNILRHTEHISKNLHIPSERLFIRIFQKEHTLGVFLYDQTKPLQAISTKELCYFFLDQATASMENIHNKMGFSIKKYLKEFADANRMDPERVRIWIHTKDGKVIVRAFDNNQYIKEIPLPSLITFFKP